MNIRRMIRPAARACAVGLILVLAGCGEFQPWGPPAPTPANRPPTCTTRDVPAPKTDPLSQDRPAEVPPGWRWIILSPEVRALKPNDINRDYCVTFAVHVYATMAGGPPLVLLDGPPHPVPYDKVTMTPWTGSYMVLAYDPASPRFQEPPVYEMQLIATYYREQDIAPELPTAFRCAILVNGATVVQDLKTDLTGLNTTVRCNIKNNFYN